MSRKIFITGTDTGVGKTYVCASILHSFTQSGLSTLGLKPIASGCKHTNGKLIHDDALALSSASSVKVHYDTTNPFAFEPAIAPHIAAQLSGQTLNLPLLKAKLQPGLSVTTDITIIEGAGGWLLPLNETETLADFVIEQEFEIILVVGMRVGCLNHALLTERAIHHAGGNLIGWIANCIDPDMQHLEDNVDTLKSILTAPHIETIRHLS